MEQTIAGPQEPVFKTKKTFSPSTVGYGHGTCPRYWHLAFSGVEFDDAPDATGAGNMNNGTYVHDRIQANLTKALAELVDIEREINFLEPPIRGFVDAIVKFNGVEAAGEIKSAKQEIFDGIVNTGKPLSSHLVQLLIYMRVLNLDNGFFYYENKNTQQFIILPVQMSKSLSEYTDEIFDWMKEVRRTFDAKDYAKPITAKRKAKQCTYCPLVAACIAKADGTSDLKPLAVRP
jgi:CRISPR/Cas system-associated exonuclease Cas4 (RecB family)